jgi:hypothetical protein
VPDQSLPPDPFTAADTGYAILAAEFKGLRKAGVPMMAASLIVAAHAVINGIAVQEQHKPEG